ncbi:hypothetical protein Harman_04380 [Haloarcula mannanilytica]|uniref:Uncharacterized protein n=1 Tax=Haloarcula mannanilytica TaxID=2509225 RepID=A0A4C2EIS0_9EURY|nr:hypothetical protein Harman_04380 [Haloarcula mannanilytica]
MIDSENRISVGVPQRLDRCGHGPLTLRPNGVGGLFDGVNGTKPLKKFFESILLGNKLRMLLIKNIESRFYWL